MKKNIVFALVLIVAAIAVSFVVYRKNLRSIVQSKPDKVIVLLDWTPNTNHTGLYVADNLGYYKRQNLDVEIIQPTEGEVPQLVAKDRADFAVSAQEEVTFARAKGIPVVSIAAILQHNTSTFASLKSAGIRTAHDFEGKRYGGWGTPIAIAMQKALMKKAGGDFDKVQQITIGSTDPISTLGRDADIQWVFYGWEGIDAKLRGIELNHIWLKDTDPAFDYYTPVIITSEKKTSEQKDLVRRFMIATSLGYEYAASHPEAASTILINAAPELNKKLVVESQKWLSSRYQDGEYQWGIQKEVVWDRYASWLYKQGLISKKINAKSAFTNEFLPKVKINE